MLLETRLVFIRSIFLILVPACIAGCLPGAVVQSDGEPEMRWFRGNLHTHSLWSDGDDYPEMIVQWYRENGYDFLAISDHNTIMEGEKWVNVPDSGKGLRAYEQYTAAFGKDWVTTRTEEDGLQVRLKEYDQFRPRFEEPERFLLIRGEEISDGFDGKPIHVNATNLEEFIAPQGGGSVLEVMQNNVDAVLVQRARTGQDMFPHVNHPNFHYAVSAADMIALEGERFFEVYNGHPFVNNQGDHEHPSTEQLWDLVLAHRLSEGRDIMYGLATDDAHNYHERATNLATTGRGWVMVRASRLQAGELIAALENGDFYASTGVTLEDVTVSGDALRIVIQPEESVTYVTQFVGTRRNFASSHASSGGATSSGGTVHPDDSGIGELLEEVDGLTPSYHMKGDELYVRARVISSRIKENVRDDDEREMAWTQPIQPDGATRATGR